MFGKLHRFHGHGSVRAVYGRGQTVRGGQLSLRYASRPEGKPYRVAVVVSRKVHKSAVTRNRIRRRVYEAVRTGAVRPPAATELVFTVFSEQLADMSTEQLQKLIDSLLQKVTAA